MLTSLVTAQRGLFINGVNASLRVDTGAFMSVDGDFVNNQCDPIAMVRFNGALYLSGSLINNDSLQFAGSSNTSSARAKLVFNQSTSSSMPLNSLLTGSVVPHLWHVVLNKPGGYILLGGDVRSRDTTEFIAGSILMNGRKWEFVDPVGAVSVMNHPWIKNESSSSRFMAISNLDTGKVIYHTTYPQAMFFNPANLGVTLHGPLDHGSSASFIRGFQAQQVGKVGAATFVRILSPAYSLLSNSVTVRHFASDAQYYSTGTFSMQQAAVYVAGSLLSEWTKLAHYAKGAPVFGGITQATTSVGLSQLNHPNISLDGKNFRLTVADPGCLIKPVSAIYIDTLKLCEGASYTLNAGNNSFYPGMPLKWEWNIAPPSYQQTLGISAPSNLQKIKVQLKDVKGCLNYDSIVIPPGAPYPQFTYLNHLNACFGDSVTIKDTVELASGTYSLDWLFSDERITSNTNLLRKNFVAVGQYWVQLIATSDRGCSAVATITNMEVYPPPAASFVHSHDCKTDAVTFTSTAVSNHSNMAITNLHWQFGAGNVSSAFTPSFTFSSAGLYTVALRATTAFGCADSVADTVRIYPRNIAAFAKHNHCLGAPSTFTNLSTCNTGSCSYQWKFGDGAVSANMHSQTTYTSSGSYLVKMIVTGQFGCPDSASSLLAVHPPPSASFGQSSASLCVNFPVYFSNSSTITAGSIKSYSWDYGNGQSAGTTHGSSSYSLPGSFLVRLIALSDSGCADTASQIITSFPQPVAQFSVSDVCQGEQSQFLSSSQGTHLNHLWHFAGLKSKPTGTMSTLYFTYPFAGIFTPSLVVTDVNGCSDTTSAPAVVRPNPVVSLGGAIKTCGYSYTLDALNPGCTFQWWPGSEQTQSIVATADGQYSVVVTSTNGCAASASVELTLNGEVHPQLGNDTTVCGGLVLDAGYPGSAFQWLHGIGTQTVFAQSSGAYAVHVTDKKQCVGSDTIHLTVLPFPVHFVGKDTTLCVPDAGLEIPCMSDAASLLWNTGSVADSIIIYEPGLYWVQGFGANGCESADTIRVSFLATPKLELGADTGSCAFVDLDAKNSGCNYLWNDGSAASQIRIIESSTVFARVTETASGCSDSDTIVVQIFPGVKVNLGNDTAFCLNTPFILDAGSDGSVYEWLSGHAERTVSVNSGGIYGVQVTNGFGCKAEDFISLTALQSPSVELGQYNRYICGNQPLVLSSPYAQNNIWSSEGGVFSAARTVALQNSGKYWLQVMKDGCYSADTVLVSFTSNTIQAMFLASTIDTVNKPVKFVNLSQPEPVSQTWYFGDGSTSSEFSPLHTYFLPTDFSVTLEVTNGFCTERITKALSVLFRTSSPEVDSLSSSLTLERFALFPNPASASAFFHAELTDKAEIDVSLSDLSGKILFTGSGSGNSYTTEVDLRDFANGFYVLQLNARSQKGIVRKAVKLVKTD